ncbi:MAG: DUF423 domain-containing protein [Alphaproteobacteria bacterium]
MRWAIGVAAISGASAVVFGAVSAHIAGGLDVAQTGWIDTALKYQIWNTLGLLAVGVLGQVWASSRLLMISAIAFAAGILMFSGSLYGMALADIDLGIVTPAGGLCLIAAWLFLVLASMVSPRKLNRL